MRHLTTAEVSTALRPFYFAVHPDLFGKYPVQRGVNENSLKQLSSFLEQLQSRRQAVACELQFFVRSKGVLENGSKLVKINLKGGNLRETVVNILLACNLPTEYVDKIPKPFSSQHKEPKTIDDFANMRYKYDIDFSKIDVDDPVFGPILAEMKMSMRDRQQSFKLLKWIKNNYQQGLDFYAQNKGIREDINNLRVEILETARLADVKWECGWNETHLRACLQGFLSIATQHPEVMHNLQDRILVFAPFTGVSLDGHIMLNIGEVRHNWLDLIKNVKRFDAVLLRIPAFEQAVSQVLRQIKIGRRKFMPKILAGEYERHLMQIATSLNDYQSYRKYPASWPQSLQEHEIVVETEAGPLMLSPTGQFIVPASCPGLLVVNFITEHLGEAITRGKNYNENKHVERALIKQCQKEMRLMSLRKDDNITPDRMIHCLQRLLEHKDELADLEGIALSIATYYSVIADGTVNIPWNWELI